MSKRIGALVLAVVMALLLVAGPLSSLTAQAAGPVTIKFHYTRPDNNYSGWDLWFWADGIDGSAHSFVAGDGEVVATITVPANTRKAGFIVRTASWQKDPDGDRLVDNMYADLYKVTSGTIDVYLTSGQAAFTVVPGDDVVLDSSAEPPAPVEAAYYVAGTADLCGNEWACDDVNNKMTLNASGLYEKVYKNVPTGTYAFKITDGTWDNSWGGSGEWGNYEFTLTEEKNVTITFNAETKEIKVILTSTELPFFVAGTADLCGSEWANNDPANKMSRNAEGLYEKFYQSVPAGTHQFKVTDGTWDNCWGNGGGNYSFTTTTETNVTITFNAETKEITVTTVAVVPYYVAGTEDLCGAGWEPGYAANKMALGADGLYTKTFKSVPAGKHEFKVTDGTWSNSWGQDGGSANYVFETTEELNVTITFNAETKEITVTFSEATEPDPIVPEEPKEYDITIKVHYHRADGDYTDWEVHMWNGAAGVGATRKFDEVDENGWKVATYYADASDTWVGFIVKKPDWTKDPDGDRKIDLSNVTGGTVHVYAESGSALNDFTTDKSEATLGNKIVSAVYDKLLDRLTYTTSLPLEGEPMDIFGLEGPDGKMVITHVTKVNDTNFVIEYEGTIDPEAAYTAYFNDLACEILIPDGYSTEGFEAEYTYTGSDLGATWSEGSTTFRLWAPTASAVSVNLYATGSDTEEGAAALGNYAMTKDVNGTWIVTINGDLNGVYYTYSVTRKGETVEACDPYARATGVNGNRAMVIDLDSTDPAGWENDNYVTQSNYTDAVIWELHVRDFSIDASSGMTNKGKYLAFTEAGTTVPGTDISTGVDYMKELGVNYVHLLPVYDINSVDETVGGYNWGYDPKNYNVPEGSYSTNPYDGAVRVNEFKQMVQSLHNAGIGVIMDVVYNHVADGDGFCFNQIVPGYFSRIQDDGSYLSNSGCGNDTASERSMVSKYIVDSVLYWATEYHIDGFRWDLVGLIDYETINAVMAAVHEVNPDIIFYGEGWDMCSWTTKEGYKDKMTIQGNADKVNNGNDVFAFFNDTVRNTLHGGVFDHTAKGFIAGVEVNDGMYNTLVESFKGASAWGTKGTTCPTPLQTVNYASCHDNYTLIDNITLDSPEATREQHVAMNNLAAAYYMTAQGIPFIHAGEDMLRSKPDASQPTGFNHNTYAAGDEINSIKWSTLANDEVMTTSKYYAGLIDFRKAHAALRQTDAAAIAESVKAYNTGDNGVVAFTIDGTNVGDDELFIVFNSKHDSYEVTLPEGEWDVYVMDAVAGTEVLATVEGTVDVTAISTLVAVKAETEPEETDPTEPEETDPTEPEETDPTEPEETDPTEPEEELDLSELEELFALLEETNPEDYTEESVENVVNVLAEILDALINEEIELTQEDIDAMADALREAIDALVPIGSETEPTEPETTAPEATTKPGTGDNAQTGDAFNMVWFAVLAVSAMATVALIAARKKLF